jgi:hypothetical protein
MGYEDEGIAVVKRGQARGYTPIKGDHFQNKGVAGRAFCNLLN